VRCSKPSTTVVYSFRSLILRVSHCTRTLQTALFSVEFPTLDFAKSAKFRMGHPPGRYPAHCSAEFGLSSPCVRRRWKRPSGPAANWIIIGDGGRLYPASGTGLGSYAYETLTRSSSDHAP
jgi:hypothetical protein